MVKNEQKQNLENEVIATEVMPMVDPIEEAKKEKKTKIFNGLKKAGKYGLAFTLGVVTKTILDAIFKGNNEVCYENSEVVEEVDNVESIEE